MVAEMKKYIFEVMRMASPPARLIQVKRDFFGAHTIHSGNEN